MCNDSCLEFGRRMLRQKDIHGKRVLEVGSLDVNGTMRPLIETHGPSEYVGVDIEMGPNVDVVCQAEDLVDRFGEGAFEVVTSTEMLEHVREWREVVRNLKGVVSPGGVLLITTRSFGVPYHGYPYDFWRYELDDMREIFSDMVIEGLEPDPLLAGVMMRARKSTEFAERPLPDYALYSIVTRKRSVDITDLDVHICKLRLRAGRILRKLRLIR